MASSRQVQLLAAAAIAVALLPAMASAVEHIVGGDGGWTLNYTIGWAEDKIFGVNDTLVFKYPKGEYTVIEVDGQTFRECYRLGNTINEWTSGNDTVLLDKPGRRWFFGGMDDHCELGLKLVVNVVPAAAGPIAPAPAPLSPAPSPQAPAPSPKTPPSTLPPPAPSSENPSPDDDSSAAGLNRYKIGEAAARAVVVAGAVAAAVFM